MFHILYMIDYNIFGLRPWGFHLTKILLHMGSSLLVFLTVFTIISRYGGEATKTYKQYAPFVAALLFATHPVNTESVTYGTTEVLFAFFYLLSFYFYVKADVAGRGVPVISVVFFFLSALSKETALTLPVLLFAYDYSFKRDLILHPKPGTIYRLLKRYLPYLVLAGIYLILRTYAIGGFFPAKSQVYLSVYEYLINVLLLFAWYLGKLILPINLNAAYVFHPIYSLLEWKGITAVAVTLCFIAALYLVRDRNRVVFFSLLLVIIPLLPVFYLLAVGNYTIAERFLYLPSAGFVIIVSLALCSIARLDASSRIAMPLMLSIVLAITALYCAGIIKRSPVWKNNLTLWSDTVNKSPDDYEAHNNLGLAYYGLGRLDEAIGEYKKALRLQPNHANAHNNLGLAYDSLGRTDEAIEELMLALRITPDIPEAHNNLGNFYYKKGRMDEATDEYKEAIRLRPDYPEAHNNLGLAYDNLGRTDEALEEFKEAISLRPDFAEAHNSLGTVYAMQQRMDEAIKEFREALRLNPGLADARFNLARAYKEKGLKTDAIRELEEYLRVNPSDNEARKMLTGLLDETNRSSQ
jgi:Flp pilus assembly protein TadD